MLKSVEGIYRAGKVELLETPEGVQESPVVVTFLTTGDLRERGIDESHAAYLRARLKVFAEDWDRPDMEDYDAL